MSGYTGPLLRVRRSIDNTEQDIGAQPTVDPSGNRVLDATALLAFTDGSDGFVTKWYDQSGNGLDVSQVSAALQPKLVSAGAYLGIVDFSAAATANTGRLALAATLTLQSYPYTTNVVLKKTGTTAVILGNASASVQFLRIDGTTAARFTPGSAYGATFNATTPVVATQTMRTNLAGAGWVNGRPIGETAASAAQARTTNGIGVWVGAASAFSVAEVTIFNAALTPAQRTALERSQGAAFGISVA